MQIRLITGPNPVGSSKEQMVVIFRYSNVIVNRHKFVAHFAFMGSIFFTNSSQKIITRILV